MKDVLKEFLWETVFSRVTLKSEKILAFQDGDVREWQIYGMCASSSHGCPW